jgi:hypothetical protein
MFWNAFHARSNGSYRMAGISGTAVLAAGIDAGKVAQVECLAKDGAPIPDPRAVVAEGVTEVLDVCERIALRVALCYML